MRTTRTPGSLLESVTAIRALDPSLTVTTVAAFLLACENEGVCQSELAFLMGDSACTVSRALARLAAIGGGAEAPGLIERHPLTRDGRLKVIGLTLAGRDLRDRLDASILKPRTLQQSAASRLHIVGGTQS